MPAKPLPVSSSTLARVASSMIGSPGIFISTMLMSGWCAGPTESQRKSPISGTVMSARTTKPSLLV